MSSDMLSRAGALSLAAAIVPDRRVHWYALAHRATYDQMLREGRKSWTDADTDRCSAEFSRLYHTEVIA
jgi:hypothetical protein